MGRSYTPPYRVEHDGSTPSAWRREYGKPTEANLSKFIQEYSRSLEAGGCNQHVSKPLGYIPYPSWARIVRQCDGVVVASLIVPRKP